MKGGCWALFEGEISALKPELDRRNIAIGEGAEVGARAAVGEGAEAELASRMATCDLRDLPQASRVYLGCRDIREEIIRLRGLDARAAVDAALAVVIPDAAVRESLTTFWSSRRVQHSGWYSGEDGEMVCEDQHWDSAESRQQEHRWYSELRAAMLAADAAAGYRLDLAATAKRLAERALSRGPDREAIRAGKPAWTGRGKAVAARCARRQAARAEAKRRAELIAAGVRAEELARAAVSEAEARRARSLADVRRNWRRLLPYWECSGGYRGLHPDAQALLERIRAARVRAVELARENQARREAAAEAARRGPRNLNPAFAGLTL
jgi:hypothetical protein